MIDSTYIQRLQSRRLAESIKRQIVFGLVMGLILIFLSICQILFVVNSLPWLWLIVLGLGITIGLMGILCPQLLSPVESGWQFITSLLGRFLFLSLLTGIYFFFFFPLGFFLKKSRSFDSYCTWNMQDDIPTVSAGWLPKKVVTDTSQKGNWVYQSIYLITYFIQNRQWVLIPVIVTLLVIGLVFFFIESSVLAPFIYTLF